MTKIKYDDILFTRLSDATSDILNVDKVKEYNQGYIDLFNFIDELEWVEQEGYPRTVGGSFILCMWVYEDEEQEYQISFCIEQDAGMLIDDLIEEAEYKYSFELISYSFNNEFIHPSISVEAELIPYRIVKYDDDSDSQISQDEVRARFQKALSMIMDSYSCLHIQVDREEIYKP